MKYLIEPRVIMTDTEHVTHYVLWIRNCEGFMPRIMIHIVMSNHM
jgi:hypothetical protein